METVEVALAFNANVLNIPLASAQSALQAQLKAAGNDLGAREKRDILSSSDVSAMLPQRYDCIVDAPESSSRAGRRGNVRRGSSGRC